MHDRELPCSYDRLFQVFTSLADYRRWISDDSESESVDCCHLVHAIELVPQNLHRLVSVRKGGVVSYLFVIFAKLLQNSNVFAALVQVIYPTLW